MTTRRRYKKAQRYNQGTWLILVRGCGQGLA